MEGPERVAHRRASALPSTSRCRPGRPPPHGIERAAGPPRPRAEGGVREPERVLEPPREVVADIGRDHRTLEIRIRHHLPAGFAGEVVGHHLGAARLHGEARKPLVAPKSSTRLSATRDVAEIRVEPGTQVPGARHGAVTGQVDGVVEGAGRRVVDRAGRQEGPVGKRYIGFGVSGRVRHVTSCGHRLVWRREMGMSGAAGPRMGRQPGARATQDRRARDPDVVRAAGSVRNRRARHRQVDLVGQGVGPVGERRAAGRTEAALRPRARTEPDGEPSERGRRPAARSASRPSRTGRSPRQSSQCRP